MTIVKNFKKMGKNSNNELKNKNRKEREMVTIPEKI